MRKRTSILFACQMTQLCRLALGKEAVFEAHFRTDGSIAAAKLAHLRSILAGQAIRFGFALRALGTSAVAFLTVEALGLFAAAALLVGQVEAARRGVAALAF